MALSNVVTSSITSATRTPSQPGYGTAMLVGHFPPAVTDDTDANVLTYDSASGLTDMVTAGFAVTDPLYVMAGLLLAAEPSPDTFKLGKRSTAYTQTVTLTCLSAVAGKRYSVDVNGTTIAYTVPGSGSPTTSTVATAIAALIDALSLVTAAAVGAVITVTTTLASSITVFENWTNTFAYADTTADSGGLATDLAAVLADDTDWYGLTIDTPSPACITAAAAFAEAHEKLFAQNTGDTACGDSGSTTDIMYTQKALAHARTYLEFCGKSNVAYAGAAMLGRELPQPPGSSTWHLKTLSGIPVDDLKSLSTAQETAIIAKNGNVYRTIANLNVTRQGISPAGEFIDIVIFRDWVNSNIAARVFGAMVNAEKIAYTDLGTQLLAAQVRSVLDDGVRVGGFKSNPPYTVTVALVASVPTNDRAARRYGGITWQAYFAGAIQSTSITGTVGV